MIQWEESYVFEYHTLYLFPPIHYKHVHLIWVKLHNANPIVIAGLTVIAVIAGLTVIAVIAGLTRNPYKL